MFTPRTANELLDCYRWGSLPDVVWHEARGESFEGKVGVAEIILNRMRDPRWPDDIEAVVFQPNQFSCYNERDPNAGKRPKPSDRAEWLIFRECCEAAAEALGGSNLTHGANHYLNPQTVAGLPVWYDPAKVAARIGRHEFLKL